MNFGLMVRDFKFIGLVSNCNFSVILREYYGFSHAMGALIMKKTVSILFFLPAAIFLSAMAVSVAAEAVKIQKISAPEVKNMLEGGQAVLIHVLSKTEYEMQHIPGSINIPIINMKTTHKLPKDKRAPIIFYCMGKR